MTKLILSFNRLIKKYKLEKVFTPSSIARLTYVKRASIENDIDKYLQTPGMQIVLYGHSGCGKSTLIYNKLSSKNIKYITTSCSTSTTFNDLIYQAFDKLDLFYISEKALKKTNSVQSEIKAKFLQAKASLSSTVSNEESTKSVRILPIQITSERLAEFLGHIGCAWVIEDFHKVSEKEKKKIADILKIFVDSSKDYPNVRIICIGAVGTARELIELDSNLQTRVAEMLIPLLSDDEICQILTTGFELMNVKHVNEIKDKIIHYSNNLASICHQICYDICYNRNFKRCNIFKEFIGNDDFNSAISSYVRKNMDTYTKIFDGIAAKFNKMSILEGLINSQKNSITFNELLKETRKIKSIKLETFTTSLNELTSIDCKEVLRYDSNSKKYSFSTPFFQAFLKMKLAIDEAEKVEQKRKKSKKNGLVLSSSNEISFDDHDKYLMEMLSDLQNIYFRRNAFESKHRDNLFKMKIANDKETDYLLKSINKKR